MSIANSNIHPPRGFSRILWRLPIWFYRANLGWLLTDHFLLLNHVGRKSGKVRQAVIEVVMRDGVNDVYYVASGFGPDSDWHQNLLKTPQAEIQAGRRRAKVKADVLPLLEAESVLMDYARRYPNAIRNLAKIIGYKIGKGDIDYGAFAQAVPIVALKVIQNNKEA